MSDSLQNVSDLQKRLGENLFAMVTSIDERGTLSSRPLTVQRLDDNGDLWFLVDRNADWVEPLEGGPVNASVSDDRMWVSFAGRATLVTDAETIDTLSDPISASFFDDRAQPVALRIVTDRIEWWASPNKAVQLIELAKATFTDREPDIGDSGAIEV